MIAIFDEKKVFKLVCPDQDVADRMKDEKEITVEIEEWVKFKMPTLVPDQTGADQVVWVTRQVFDTIRNPPAVEEDTEEKDVDMA